MENVATEEFISRTEALEDFESCNAENPNWTPQRVKTLLLRQPAADVTEVHHARWEEADWHEYDAQSGETIRFPKAAIVCSNCRNAFKKDALWKRNFCPNCGEKMEGAAE
jgi:hypothetical protein